MKIVQVGEITITAHSSLKVNIQQKMDYGNNFTDVTGSTLKPKNRKYLLGTGVTNYTKRNNIYDLAGNCWEWTTESDSSDLRVGRGRQLQQQWVQYSSLRSQPRFPRPQLQRHFLPLFTLRKPVSLRAIW